MTIMTGGDISMCDARRTSDKRIMGQDPEGVGYITRRMYTDTRGS